MTLESFFGDETKTVEQERRDRIRLSVFAFAYEYEDNSLITDHEFDALCLKIDTRIKTGNRKLDNFFSKHFDPATGMWIRKHPDKAGLKNIYLRYFK